MTAKAKSSAAPKPDKKPTKKKPAKKPPVKKATKKKPAPKKKQAITVADFEKWFLKLDLDKFMSYSQLWNEANLKLKIPKLEGYDQWLNYFKDLSPAIIKKLATSGIDFLPTDGYAALSRWHDIISHPHRIDRIHQAGLNRNPSKDGKTITKLAQDNDVVGVLMAIRDRLAEKMEKGAGARDTAALAKEIAEIMTQIKYWQRRQGPKKETKLGELMGEVDLRKRPPRNGGGARHTSFKSRVTIDDMENANAR